MIVMDLENKTSFLQALTTWFALAAQTTPHEGHLWKDSNIGVFFIRKD